LHHHQGIAIPALRVQKGKIENNQNSPAFPFPCGCFFSLQPARQIQFTNLDNRPKSGCHNCYDNLAG
jgi:hypothetical protein